MANIVTDATILGVHNRVPMERTFFFGKEKTHPLSGCRCRMLPLLWLGGIQEGRHWLRQVEIQVRGMPQDVHCPDQDVPRQHQETGKGVAEICPLPHQRPDNKGFR